MAVAVLATAALAAGALVGSGTGSTARTWACPGDPVENGKIVDQNLRGLAFVF